MMFFKQNGFTLVEVLIVVVVLSIIASVAFPLYDEYVNSSRRAEGQAFAMDIASRQERFYTQNGVFTSTITAGGLNLPDNLSQNDAYTAAVVTENDDTTYEITVTPNGWTDDQCGALTLTNIGEKESAIPSEDCW
jgi:type IV pilus assembly protein PilE